MGDKSLVTMIHWNSAIGQIWTNRQQIGRNVANMSNNVTSLEDFLIFFHQQESGFRFQNQSFNRSSANSQIKPGNQKKNTHLVFTSGYSEHATYSYL